MSSIPSDRPPSPEEPAAPGEGNSSSSGGCLKTLEATHALFIASKSCLDMAGDVQATSEALGDLTLLDSQLGQEALSACRQCCIQADRAAFALSRLAVVAGARLGEPRSHPAEPSSPDAALEAGLPTSEPTAAVRSGHQDRSPQNPHDRSQSLSSSSLLFGRTGGFDEGGNASGPSGDGDDPVNERFPSDPASSLETLETPYATFRPVSLPVRGLEMSIAEYAQIALQRQACSHVCQSHLLSSIGLHIGQAELGLLASIQLGGPCSPIHSEPVAFLAELRALSERLGAYSRQILQPSNTEANPSDSQSSSSSSILVGDSASFDEGGNVLGTSGDPMNEWTACPACGSSMAHCCDTGVGRVQLICPKCDPESLEAFQDDGLPEQFPSDSAVDSLRRTCIGCGARLEARHILILNGLPFCSRDCVVSYEALMVRLDLARCYLPYHADRNAVVRDVLAERDRQDSERGAPSYRDWPQVPPHLKPHVWFSILTEEVGETSTAVHDCLFHPTDATWSNLREELVQVAAVAMAFLEFLGGPNSPQGRI